MKLEKDFEEFISLLNVHEVKYVVVGAYAVSFYARPRNTGDIDFFIGNSRENISRLFKVLEAFGFGALDVSYDDLQKENTVLQLGYEPVRIDIMTGISGLTFERVFENSVAGKLGDEDVNFISLDDLITNKRASDRIQDHADAELLEKFREDAP